MNNLKAPGLPPAARLPAGAAGGDGRVPRLRGVVLIALCAWLALAGSVRAQFTFAADNAGNYGGNWVDSSDGGTGFGGWGFATGLNNVGSFLGNPNNDGIANTNMDSTAFGMYSTFNNGQYANRSRGFDAGLGLGDSFAFDWGINLEAGTGNKGFDLKAGSTTIFNVNNAGTAAITTTGGGTADASAGTNNMRVTLTRTTNGYTFRMTRRSDGTAFSTNISTIATIDNFSFYIGNQSDANGGRNMYFDNLSITNSGVFNSGGNVQNASTFTGTGSLSIGNNTTLSLTGGGNHNYTGATTVSNGSTLVFAGSGTSQFASTIGGTGGNVVMNNSAGTVVLTNSNTYAGNTTIAAGTVLIGNANALGSTGALAVNAGGRLQLSNNITMSRAITLAGDGIDSRGALQNVSGDNMWSGGISNSSGARINSDGGTLTISGNITNATNQSLYIGGAGNITLGGTLTGSLATGNGALFKNEAGVLTLTANNSALTGLVRLFGGTISITNVNSLGSGVLELGATTTQGILLVNSNSTRAANLLITDNSTNSVINVAAGQSFTNSGSLTQSGASPSRTTKFAKAGSGTLVFAAASGNSYNGRIQIGDGTVVAGTSTALGTNANTTDRGVDLGLDIGDASQANNVALRAGNGVTISNSVYVAPNTGGATRTIGLSGSGSATFNNQFYLDGSLTVDAGGSNTDLVILGGNLTNTGGLIKTNAGILVLSASNDHSGGTTLGQGTLRINNPRALGTGILTISGAATIDNTSGAAITLANSNAQAWNADFTFTGTANLNLGTGAVTLGGNRQVTVAGNELAVGGRISGAFALSKAGLGTLTLSGANTYSGGTLIAAGTLVVNGQLGGATTVNSGATLAGSGQVGATTVGAGGTISPGNSPGTMFLTNGLSFNPGGNYDWQISNAAGSAGVSNGWDLLAVSGGAWDIRNLTTNSFNINLWSLSGTSPDTNGPAANFHRLSSYRWEILTYTSLLGTFSSDLFSINVGARGATGGFANATNNGNFSLRVDGNSLDLLFTRTPSPLRFSDDDSVVILGDAIASGGTACSDVGAYTNGAGQWTNGPWVTLDEFGDPVATNYYQVTASVGALAESVTATAGAMVPTDTNDFGRVSGFAGTLFEIQSLQLVATPSTLTNGAVATNKLTAVLHDGSQIEVDPRCAGWTNSGPVALSGTVDFPYRKLATALRVPVQTDALVTATFMRGITAAPVTANALVTVQADGSDIGIDPIWLAAHNLVTFEPSSDADKDGIPQLLEAVFNFNPHARDSQTSHSLGFTNFAGTNYLTLSFRCNKGNTRVSVSVERATGLSPANFSTSGVIEVMPRGVIDANTDWRTFRSTAPFGRGKEFLRLKAIYSSSAN